MSSKNLQSDSVQAGATTAAWTSRTRAAIQVVALLLASGLSFMFGREFRPDAPSQGRVQKASGQEEVSAGLTIDGRRLLKPGPWGELEVIPMAITPPDELHNISQTEASTIQWFFKDFTRDTLAKLLDSLDLPDDQRARLLDPSRLRSKPGGIEVSPPNDVILSMPAKARQVLYELLLSFPENSQELAVFETSWLEKSFQDAGISREHVELFRKLSCSRGEGLIFSGVPCLLSQLPSTDDKHRFLRALLRRDTLLLRLHITPRTDIKALAEYWGRGPTTMDVKAMLTSLQQIPGGIWANIGLILPARSAGILYTFPPPQQQSNGQPVNMDCHWTSFNFFKGPFEPGYPNEQINVVMNSEYTRIQTSPRYGDVAIFMDANEKIFHSAVFLADDIVYTKDGANALRPWVLSTVSDVQRLYAGYQKTGQGLKVVYYRNRNY